RAFSGGRLRVNHLQHRTGSQRFKAQIAVGSWFGTPLIPDSKIPTGMIRNRMTRSIGTEWLSRMWTPNPSR
ncbi:hypothetical protein HD554DRAFT_2010427, partial [Boletus coccyginus]